jgi:hypothetical protein
VADLESFPLADLDSLPLADLESFPLLLLFRDPPEFHRGIEHPKEARGFGKKE